MYLLNIILRLEMAQTLTGIRSILSKSGIYNFFQLIMGQKKDFKLFVETLIKPSIGNKILDIGCGTAAILEFLPDIEYVGFDICEEYIKTAREKFGSRGTFKCALIDYSNLEQFGKFDIVLLIGVLHHLDDALANQIFLISRDILKDGGRLIAIEPTISKGQNIIAKILIKCDRGQNIRSPGGYKVLAEPFFKFLNVKVRHKKFIPYTHAFLECVK